MIAKRKSKTAVFQLVDVWLVLFISVTTLAISVVVYSYGELFFEFGEFAKICFLRFPILAFFATPIIFWLSSYLCRRFAIEASGNTVNHIESVLVQLQKTPNNLGKEKAAFKLRSILVNIFSSLLATLGGGSLGREAPSVYISTGLFINAGILGKYSKKLFQRISLENCACAGTAVGFAVAFHAPIAGFIYVIEKLFQLKLKNLFDNVVWTILALFLAVLVLYKATPLFGVYDLGLWFGNELALVFIIAVVCGASSYLLKMIAINIYQKAIRIKSSWWHLVPILCGFAVSCMSVFGGVYSFGGGIRTAQDILGGTDISMTMVFVRMINTMLTFASGCAGGLVAPAIAIGSSIGSIMSNLMTNIDPKIFILSGMVAFLNPILLTPFATAIVILETADQSMMSLPFLFISSITSLLVAKVTAKLVNNT